MKKFVFKSVLTCIFLFGFVLQSCSSDNQKGKGFRVSFTFQPTEVLVDSPVQFTSTSAGVHDNAIYKWEFGDGSISSLKNPIHTYKTLDNGIYEVTLNIQEEGRVESVSKNVFLAYSNEIKNRKSLIEKLGDTEILICAHRGNHSESPENSIASIEQAIAYDIPMVEIDVRSSKDGQLILMHDKTIDRTTNGSGNVSDFTLEELKAFKLYNSYGVLTDQKIPTLKEVLAISRGRLYIDLDINNKVSFTQIYPIVKQYGMVKQVLFYSKDLPVINNILNTDQFALPMPNVFSESDFDVYKDLKINVAHYSDESFNQNLVNKAKERGWFILKNAYVNTNTLPENDSFRQINKIVNLEGNIIQTDHPVVVQQYIN